MIAERTEVANRMQALRNPSKEIIEAVKTVLMAKAYTMTVKPIVLEIQNEVLNKFNYIVCPETWGEYEGKIQMGRILDPNKAYEMGEKDFGHYLTEIRQRYLKHFPKLEVDHCPLLVAEELERQAQRNLVDILEPITGLSGHQLICSGLEKYKNYIELNLKYLTQFVKL